MYSSTHDNEYNVQSQAKPKLDIITHYKKTVRVNTANLASSAVKLYLLSQAVPQETSIVHQVALKEAAGFFAQAVEPL